MTARALVIFAGLAASLPALGQSRYLLTDRVGDAVFSVWDQDGNGVINEPGEVSLYFNAGNAAGTPAATTLTGMAVRPDGLVVVGDYAGRQILSFRDLDGNGDAMGLGESRIAADVSSASGLTVSAPSGFAFDALSRLYVTNAGNANGPDAVYRLEDLNGDDDFLDLFEAADFIAVPFFGPGNGAFGPQQIVIASTQPHVVGYFRNATSGLHGIYRFADSNGNDRADDLGEVTTFFDASNLSGIVLSAGLPLEMDAASPGKLYTVQTATGGVDELYRIGDANGNMHAQDADEALLVFTTAEAGFSSADIASLADGRVLLTDVSGNRVIELRDLDNDQRFLAANERTTYFLNSAMLMADVRHIAAAAPICTANCDQSTSPPVLNVADFTCFLQRFAAGDVYANCDNSTQLPTLNVADFTCFLQSFAAGCP